MGPYRVVVEYYEIGKYVSGEWIPLVCTEMSLLAADPIATWLIFHQGENPGLTYRMARTSFYTEDPGPMLRGIGPYELREHDEHLLPLPYFVTREYVQGQLDQIMKGKDLYYRVSNGDNPQSTQDNPPEE